jgi:hemerythrin superfamily protein
VSDDQRDVIEILTHDHREVEEMFQELERLKGTQDEESNQRRKDLVEQVTIELVRHSVAEEVIVYPQVEKRVSEDEAEHAKEEHAEAEETMKQLEGLDPEDTAFDNELETLMKEIRHHIEDEEGKIFNAMREAFSAEELVEMGKNVERLKKVAPTRPHPHVPNEAAVRGPIGPIAGLFDRFRDAVQGKGTD